MGFMKKSVFAIVLSALIMAQGSFPVMAEPEEFAASEMEEILSEESEVLLDDSEETLLTPEEALFPEEDTSVILEEETAAGAEEFFSEADPSDETGLAVSDGTEEENFEESVIEEVTEDAYSPGKDSHETPGGEEIPDELTSGEIEQVGIPSGVCGDNLTWSLENNVLYISGTGVLWDEVFEFESGFSSVIFENGVTGIGQYSFAHCDGLKKLTIGDSVRTIGAGSFLWCTNLTDVTFGINTARIDSEAFQECFELRTLKFTGNAPKFGSYAFSGVTATAYYPAGDSTWTANVMKDYGGTITWKPYGSSAAVKQPRLIICYNGAYGIGVKFYKEENASEYIIYRKYNGVWSLLKTVSAGSPELQANGNTLMFTDTSVAKLYGKGYIYSVAAKRGSSVSSYDKAGVAIYRLKPPELTRAANTAAGAAAVSWTGVFGKTEVNANYDLQYTEYANGKAGTFKSLRTLPGFGNTTTSVNVRGLTQGKTYVFRIRCSKTNKDRGTFYSEYSKWLSVKITR